jgi:TonB family protein
LLTVETVPGLTPRGEGTGVEGTRPSLNDNPANANPLLTGVKLKMDETVSPLKTSRAKARAAKLPLTAKDISEKYKSLPIGINTRDGREGQDLSEGGMGNARKAGSPDGLVEVGGAIGGRKYAAPVLDYPGNLPEESELQITVLVTPQGDVIEARVTRSSGYPELNQFYLAKAREFRFESLPPAQTQENVSGTLYFRFQYGKAKVQ